MPVLVPVSDLVEAAADAVLADRFDMAKRVLSRILAGAPRHAEALHLRGVLALRQKRPDDAASWMEQARAAGADGPYRTCDLAVAYSMLDRRQEAALLVRRARVQAPDDAGIAALARQLCG